MQAAISTNTNSKVGKGHELVKLDKDHPGFRDSTYRQRRNMIAELALNHKNGQPVPTVEYSDEEQGVWKEVWTHLQPLLNQHACSSYLASLKKVGVSQEQIPQLGDVNQTLSHFTEMRLEPVAGLVNPREFLTCLKHNIFLSTQYVRHSSTPLYTPEPDVIHEIVGHAAYFANPLIVHLNKAFGEACAKTDNEDTIEQLIRVYWYTLEFGLTYEADQLKAYGSGILSSYGELGRSMTHPNLRPFSISEVAATPYEPTDYQQILFVVPSLEELSEILTAWFDSLSYERKP